MGKMGQVWKWATNQADSGITLDTMRPYSSVPTKSSHGNKGRKMVDCCFRSRELLLKTTTHHIAGIRCGHGGSALNDTSLHNGRTFTTKNASLQRKTPLLRSLSAKECAPIRWTNNTAQVFDNITTLMDHLLFRLSFGQLCIRRTIPCNAYAALSPVSTRQRNQL